MKETWDLDDLEPTHPAALNKRVHLTIPEDAPSTSLLGILRNIYSMKDRELKWHKDKNRISVFRKTKKQKHEKTESKKDEKYEIMKRQLIKQKKWRKDKKTKETEMRKDRNEKRQIYKNARRHKESKKSSKGSRKKMLF